MVECETKRELGVIMNRVWAIMELVLSAVLGLSGVARGSVVEMVSQGFASGGGAAVGGAYRIQSERGGTVGGVVEGGGFIHKLGNLAQGMEPTSLIILVTDTNLPERASTRPNAVVVMDDETQLRLDRGDLDWGVFYGPLSAHTWGWVIAEVVYEDTPACLFGRWQSLTGSVNMRVLDTIPDNYGSYAGDGLPDDWQVTYFGLDNTNAMPNADPFGHGQDNRFKYVAGLNPTNPNDRFEFTIGQGPRGPEISMNPRFSSRGYEIQYQTHLGETNWQTLTEALVEDNGLTRTLVDTNSPRMRHYRVVISKP